MKQLFLKVNDGKIISIDTVPPINKDNHVIVETIYSAVSAGTERSLSSFGSKNLIQKAMSRPDQVKTVLEKMSTDGILTTIDAAFNRLKDPLPMGYSGVGRVIEVGRGVTNINVGDIVAMAGQAYHSEINRVNKNLLAKIPSHVQDLKPYALCALGGIALQGIHQAKVEPGETVAVIGLGLLGHITTRILNAYGCDVIGYDVIEKEVKGTELKGFILSNDESAYETTLGLTNNRGVDKVIITAATSSNDPMDLAAAIARDRGTICMIGVTKMELDRKPYYDKELTFTIARSYGPGRYDDNYEVKGIDYPIGYVRFTEGRNIEEFVRLLSTKKLNLDELLTHVFDFDKSDDAYELITENKNNENYIGILLKYKGNVNLNNRLNINSEKRETRKDIINVGLIGAGNFTRATIIPNMKKSGKYHFKALATTGGISTAQAISNTKFEYITNDYKKLLLDSDIDLIVVSTQHNTHGKFVIEALMKDKNVYCEKPLCLTSKELEEIELAYKDSKGNLFVGVNRRFAPLTQKAKKSFTPNSAKIIDIVVNAGYIPHNHWTQDEFIGGGRIIGEAIHFVDLAQTIDSSKIIDLEIKYVDHDGHIDKDNIFITMKLESGSIANIIYTSMGNKKYPKEQIRVFSDGKIIEINNFIKYIGYGMFKKGKIKLRQDKGIKSEYNYIYDVLRGKKNNNIIYNVLNNHRMLIREIEKVRNCENNGK
jgi:predicted dehydrogenase/threonine dehydrogenase-like Zn-dependent dehydrogenase